MQFVVDILGAFFGTPLRWLYLLFGNYGVALIVLTAIIQVAFTPMKRYQQRQLEKSAKANQEIDKLKEKYKDAPKTFEQEAEKIYAQYDVVPLAGVLTTGIQLIVFWGLYRALSTPLTSIVGVAKDVVTELLKAAAVIPGFNAQGGELSLIDAIRNNASAFSSFSSDMVQAIQSMNASFFGVNLCAKPDLENFTGWIIPSAVALITAFPVLKLLFTAIRKKSAKLGGLAALFVFFASISIPVSFQLPAGMGLYWITSGIVSMGIEFVHQKSIKNKERDGCSLKEMESNGERSIT